MSRTGVVGILRAATESETLSWISSCIAELGTAFWFADGMWMSGDDDDNDNGINDEDGAGETCTRFSPVSMFVAVATSVRPTALIVSRASLGTSGGREAGDSAVIC